ncbi:MAG: alpha/beta fold hydrolase [Rhodospirillales bacterium]|nr:alpha/beta fold hydrolase [Rhodospirillales bacterium]
MPVLDANGIETYYEVHGAGSPVLLTAGLGGAGPYWREQVEPFARVHTVIVYDQRGTGRSSHVPVASVAELAGDALALLDALKIGEVHFVGHSTGGAIGQVLALDQPGRLKSLVLYATVHRSDPFRRRMWSLRKAVLADMGPKAYAQLTSLVLYPPAWIAANDARLAKEEAIAERMLSNPSIMASRIDAILAHDRAEELSGIRTPTLVLCARDDLMTPAYFSEDIAARIPKAEFVRLDGGGHACSKTRDQEFNRHVLDFIARHDCRRLRARRRPQPLG